MAEAEESQVRRLYYETAISVAKEAGKVRNKPRTSSCILYRTDCLSNIAICKSWTTFRSATDDNLFSAI